MNTAHAPRSLEENVSLVHAKWSIVVYTPKSQMMMIGGCRLCLWMPHFAKYGHCQPYGSLKNFSWNLTDPWNAQIWARLSHVEQGGGGLSCCILCSCCCLGGIWWGYTRSAITWSSGEYVLSMGSTQRGTLTLKGTPSAPFITTATRACWWQQRP